MKNKFSSAVSILLVLIMALTPAAVFGDSASAQSDSAESDTLAAEEQTEVIGLYEMNFLNSLGIVSFTEGMLTKSVTNEEFAGAAGIIGGIVSDYYQDGTLDMLVKLGHLPSACAYSDRTIKYKQAVKGMVSVLGYDAPAQKIGGYPNGYITEASKLKITNGIDNADIEADLTYGMLCIMMYNALDVRLVVQTDYGPDPSFEKDETVLNGVFEIYEAYGRVSANSVTSLSGKDGYDPGIIEIDGVEFNNMNSAYDDLFGYNVRYYYKTEGTNSNNLLYMELDKSSNRIIETEVNDGTYVKDKKIYYYTQSGKLKGASISNGYCLVYNKKVTNKGLENYAGKINGYVKMADTNNDGKYDFIEINSYDTFYVSRISSYNCEIFDKYDSSKSASFDKTETDTKYIIKDTKGNEIDFSAIKKGCVVSVLMSDDKTVATAIVSSDSVSVTVDSVSNLSGNSTSYIYSADEKYPISDSIVKYIDNNITIGEEYKLALDFCGYVAGFEKSEDVFEAGLIMGLYSGKKGLKDDAQIKIFSSAGVISTIDFAEKVKVDGVTYKEKSKAQEALYKTENGQKVYKSTFIRYCIKNDKIVNIDTAFYNKDAESENSLQIVGPEGTKLLSRDAQCFASNYGSGFVYDASTTVFMSYLYDDPENEDEYNIISVSSLSNANSYTNVTGYATSAKTPDVEYVVIGLTTSAAAQDYYTIMFDSVVKRIDDKGEDKYCIKGVDLVKNTSIEKTVNDISKLEGVKKGDILNVRFTFGGEVGGIFKAYDAETDTVLFTDTCATDGTLDGKGPSYGTSPRWLYGRAYSSGSSYVYVLPESQADLIDKITIADCKMTAVKRRQPGVFIYDTKESKDREFLTSVTIDSVNDYINTGVEADRILVYSYPAEYSGIIIFR